MSLPRLMATMTDRDDEVLPFEADLTRSMIALGIDHPKRYGEILAGEAPLVIEIGASMPPEWSRIRFSGRMTLKNLHERLQAFDKAAGGRRSFHRLRRAYRAVEAAEYTVRGLERQLALLGCARIVPSAKAGAAYVEDLERWLFEQHEIADSRGHLMQHAVLRSWPGLSRESLIEAKEDSDDGILTSAMIEGLIEAAVEDEHEDAIDAVDHRGIDELAQAANDGDDGALDRALAAWNGKQTLATWRIAPGEVVCDDPADLKARLEARLLRARRKLETLRSVRWRAVPTPAAIKGEHGEPVRAALIRLMARRRETAIETVPDILVDQALKTSRKCVRRSESEAAEALDAALIDTLRTESINLARWRSHP